MGILDIFKSEGGKKGNLPNTTSSALTKNLTLSSPKRFDRSYLEKKLALLQEEKRLWEYEQNFVPAYHFEDEGAFQKLKLHIENTWRNVLIALLFLVKGNDRSDETEDEFSDIQIMDAVEKLSPGLKKTIAKNLLKKMESQKKVIDAVDIDEGLSAIHLLKIDEQTMRDTLQLLIDEDKDLCHPRDLEVNYQDPAWKEYATYWQQLQNKKNTLTHILKSYSTYIDYTQKIYDTEQAIHIHSKEEIIAGVKNNFVIRHEPGTFAHKLEMQQLEKDIQGAVEARNSNKKAGEKKKHQYKIVRLYHQLQIIGAQRAKVDMGFNANDNRDIIKQIADLYAEKINNLNTGESFQRYVQFHHSGYPTLSGGKFTLYRVQVHDRSLCLQVTEDKEEHLLGFTKDFSKHQRMKLIDFFSRAGTQPIDIGNLYLPEVIAQHQMNQYAIMQGRFIRSSVYDLDFRDTQEGTLEEFKRRLDDWITHHITYEQPTNGLSNPIVHISHPTFGHRACYDVRSEDWKNMGRVYNIKEAYNRLSYQDSRWLLHHTVGTWKDIPDTIDTGGRRESKNGVKFLFRYLSDLGVEIALPYKQKLCELTEVVMQDIGLQNIELPGNKEFLEKFILAYTIFCKETVNLIIDDAQPGEDGIVFGDIAGKGYFDDQSFYCERHTNDKGILLMWQEE